MSKPDDIPQDVWDEAKSRATDVESREWDDETFLFVVEAIARAIIAATAKEREACAEMAELVGIPMAANGQPILMIPVQIAKRIRER